MRAGVMPCTEDLPLIKTLRLWMPGGQQEFSLGRTGNVPVAVPLADLDTGSDESVVSFIATRSPGSWCNCHESPVGELFFEQSPALAWGCVSRTSHTFCVGADFIGHAGLECRDQRRSYRLSLLRGSRQPSLYKSEEHT